MGYLAFRRIKGWACQACGVCCFRFKPILKEDEYRKIERFYPGRCGWDGKSYYILKTKHRGCYFLVNNRCYLQPLRLKPISCRLWPFILKLEPEYGDADFAKIIFQNRKYYIYVDTFCQGINRGDPQKYQDLICEIFKIWLFPETSQIYLTSNTSTEPLTSILQGKLDQTLYDKP
jgi:Fe-S-cluster containining protein